MRNTRTMLEIWTAPAKLKEDTEKMQAKVAKTSAAAKKRNLDPAKTAYRAAAKLQGMLRCLS